MLLLFSGRHFVQAKTDGNRNHDYDSVRRVPRVGTAIPQKYERQLRRRLHLLQKPIRTLSTDGDDTVNQLLPGVITFERAVRSAFV